MTDYRDAQQRAALSDATAREITPEVLHEHRFRSHRTESRLCISCGSSIEGLMINDLRFRAEAAERERDELRRAAEMARSLIEDLDPQLKPINGDDGFIEGYRMNTGIWHKLLAWARDPALRAALSNEGANPADKIARANEAREEGEQ